MKNKTYTIGQRVAFTSTGVVVEVLPPDPRTLVGETILRIQVDNGPKQLWFASAVRPLPFGEDMLAEHVNANCAEHDFNRGPFTCVVDSKQKAIRFAHAEQMEAELRALVAWALEHTGPTMPNSPHEILVRASNLFADMEAGR